MSRDANRSGCSEFRRSLRTTRRGFLKAGALGFGAGALGLSDVLRCEARVARAPAGRSVIILWMRGGPAHQDTWDPKPEAPLEYRGEFGVTRTNVPGILLSDMLPMCARVMDKWSIVRSLHHEDAGHSAADQICFTGYKPGPNPDENVHPSCGSIVAEQLGDLTPELPAYVMVPRMVPGTGAAYLGVGFKPFETLADPAADGPFRVPNFALSDGVTVDRIGDRRSLLSGFDRLRNELDRSGQMHALDRFQQQAWNILTTDTARRAFDLDAEPRAVRERYGFLPAFDPGAPDRCGAPAWSQRMLLARRLVEAGVRLVTVDLRWWDTHVLGFDSLRRGFLPRFDRAYSALIEDLDQRGLLEHTLVVAWGEFGRTPKVNAQAGRDHYPSVFSAALAGGPVKGGRVVGASDSKAAFPVSDAKTPQDVLATIYRFLGVEVDRPYLDHAGRPHPALPFGEPIEELC
ncbi:MAG TPA: DUF1501 domain-containing protein [Planctomycetaceae bacterium]|nr:DUF1501 domain-containing protein [Planctomycetaceae bacterium]